ncbi:P-loop containing nucleoside triphosphate hydrolase protein [Mycotypha africana]|uniref:P-loop containing nucleoside triphosphate hydrolase protein n=1 Tax=Mycotypha africana TaxID=64632 RepID=UPI002301F24B|nr:P-loop containing nucleoside triphosphate hydrolase protein [Mycotypha africana]KAI8987380.1 P-loop containing nucleoside triphosphate hydrolase protein [Mycotypha africana]
MTTSDSRENSLENFIVNTDDEVEAAETTITRRQRKVMRPVTYENEFKIRETMRKKPARAPSVYIPSYKDEDFIKSHCHFCTSCGRSGNVNGNGASPDTTVQLGKEVATKRLLLCQNCSYSQHNSCFSINIVKYLINFETGEFTCSLCNSKTSNKSKDCVNCNRLATNDSKISLRCRTCKRLFHRDCIKKGLTVKLAESVKDENIDELYSKGQCVECLTYFWKLKRKPKAILANREIDGRKEMYVGWQDMSYRHAEWVSHSWIQAVSPHMHAAYERRLKAGKIVPFSQDWLLIDRIVSVEWENKSKNEARRILAVYKDCEYGEAVWDEPPQKDDPILYPDYDIALKRYIQASQVRPPKGIKNLVGKVRTAASVENYQKHAIKSQPEFLKGGTLMQHQLDALNWLLYKWEQAHNCILADDMGLGKTIQIISYLFYLYKKYQIYPFLIVVPNSTATNWVREFEKWASEMTVVPFFGGKVAREIATKYEVFNERGEAKFHALVATYESVQTEPQLQRIFWPALVVDESQRLKNDRTMLYQHLKRLHLDHIVLLSGTPLQNNLRELFNMMHFIRPTDFVGTDAENYDDLKKEQVDELHTKLRPYFLRRTKEEVLKNLPPKYELIVPLSMTILQKELYKQCLSREIYETLAEATGTKRSKGLTSIFVNLRKVLNHPYLLDGVEKRDPNPEQVHKAMIEACAKLKLLHQMLPKLKEKGHRVLIFSTMSRTLDVIEDYLTYEGRRFVRIDGSVGERDRVRAMDSFNNPNSTVEVFLLTTRAGGVGINLTAADTVIIWDSDANPYADLQAISRAHRIGQTNMVIIYRFMTRLTVEEKILQIGKKKMALEHVVVERMKKAEEGENYEDIESILRFGTEALFSDDASADITYDEAAINNLLDREQYKEAAEEQKRKDIEDLEGKAKEQNGLDFGFAKIWQNDGTIEELPADGEDERENNDTNFWEKFLAKQKAEALRKREEKRLAEENLGRGARKRVVTVSVLCYKET